MPRPNTSMRSLPYPAIEDGNFSFPKGSYHATVESIDNAATTIVLRHEISGAPFIEELIAQGKAEYACLVSVARTGYRKLHTTHASEQAISWDPGVAGAPPILGPLVLYTGKDFSHTFRDEDGVAKIWQQKTIELPTGARLARAAYLHAVASIGSLITVRCDEDMQNGSFTIAANTNEGFYFSLNAAADIFKFIQNPQENNNLRASILTHAVSQCFNILQRDYSASGGEEAEDDQWRQYSNLAALSDWLKSEALPHWSEEDFDAVAVATRLYPIQLPKSNEEEG